MPAAKKRIEYPKDTGATCCRGCLEKWHKIPKGAELTKEQKEYVVNIIMEWIERQMRV